MFATFFSLGRTPSIDQGHVCAMSQKGDSRRRAVEVDQWHDHSISSRTCERERRNPRRPGQLEARASLKCSSSLPVFRIRRMRCGATARTHRMDRTCRPPSSARTFEIDYVDVAQGIPRRGESSVLLVTGSACRRSGDLGALPLRRLGPADAPAKLAYDKHLSAAPAASRWSGWRCRRSAAARPR
jgi:hypothetical protein